MPTLLLAEHDNASLKDATNKTLTAARALGTDVHILVAGHHCKAVAEAAAKLDLEMQAAKSRLAVHKRDVR